jgi:hypothetical protein
VAILLALCCCMSADHSQWLEKTLYLPDSFGGLSHPQCLVCDSANNAIYVGDLKRSGRLVQRLESGPRQRGFHVVRWDGEDNRGHFVPAGVYLVRLSAGGRVSTGRVTLIR